MKSATKARKSYSSYEKMKLVYLVTVAGMTQQQAAEAMTTRPNLGCVRKISELKRTGEWDQLAAHIAAEGWKPHWRNDDAILNPKKSATKPARKVGSGRPRNVGGAEVTIATVRRHHKPAEKAEKAEKFTLGVLATSIAWTAGIAFLLGVSVGYNLL